jgi:hypothetical protein
MKKLILIGNLCAMVIFAQAQNTGTIPPQQSNQTNQGYEQMLQNQQKVDFRTQVNKSLGLTDQQIKDFDPLYTEYMARQSQLAQRRMDLLNNYVKETGGNPSAATKSNYLKDYMSLQNQEMALRNEYIDKFGNSITPNNAFGFFLLEDAAATPIYSGILQQRYGTFINGRQPYNNGSMNQGGNNMNGNTPNGTNNNGNNSIDNSKYRKDTGANFDVHPNTDTNSNLKNSDNANAGTNTRSNPDNPITNSATQPRSDMSNTVNSATTGNAGTIDNRNGNTGTSSSNTSATVTRDNPATTTARDNTTVKGVTGNDVNTRPGQTLSTNGDMNNANYAGTSASSTSPRSRTEIDAYSNWSRSTTPTVGGSHQYTRDGLKSLTAAISNLASGCNATSDNSFRTNQQKITANANELQ